MPVINVCIRASQDRALDLATQMCKEFNIHGPRVMIVPTPGSPFQIADVVFEADSASVAGLTDAITLARASFGVMAVQTCPGSLEEVELRGSQSTGVGYSDLFSAPQPGPAA